MAEFLVNIARFQARLAKFFLTFTVTANSSQVQVKMTELLVLKARFQQRLAKLHIISVKFQANELNI